jgi:hypothetical protein
MLPCIKTPAEPLSPHLINFYTTVINVLRQEVVFLIREVCFSFLRNVHTGFAGHSILLFSGGKAAGA